MKKILSIILVAMAALIAAPQASAYSEEMAEFAQLLNEGMAGEDGVAATYNGRDIVIDFPASYFDADDVAMFADVDDMQIFAPLMIEVLNESMGADTLMMLGSLLDAYDTNLVIRMNLNSTTKTITLTPSMLMGQG
ncbi:MAG: hypothetical protein NC217_06985 [Muribaculaceae bacterium]|nr:hypothetical protein [Muribaculaceae bacterium]